MFKTLSLLIVISLFSFPVLAATWAVPKPQLMLAKSFQPGLLLTDFWVSEKYDGVRAYWNGQQLLTRRGNLIYTPQWFTADFPKTPLDGELWLGRGRFEEMSALSRQHQPDEEMWRQVRYMVFDLPALTNASFEQRNVQLKELLAEEKIPSWLSAVPFFQLSSQHQLERYLAALKEKGGEGLMLYHREGRYSVGRSDSLLKLKPYDDAEAVVIGYNPGKGKYLGMLGSLRVRTDAGLEFSIGSGLTDQLRAHPPEIGSQITFAYNGFTNSGKPRFARYLRMHTD